MGEQGTRLETEDDVRRALDEYRAMRQGPQAAAPIRGEFAPIAPHTPAGGHHAASARAPGGGGESPGMGPPLYRPRLRPPTPILTVCDDGSEDGEAIRIRQERFVIGRTEGDLVIPHDLQISSRHAELRQAATLSPDKPRFGSEDRAKWTLVDLRSTNGTYVRVGHAALEHGQEFVVGTTRFRFENEAPQTAAKPANVPEQGTRLWQSAVSLNDGSQATGAAILEITANNDGARFELEGAEAWLGRDAARCQVCIAEDPLVSPMHAKLRRQNDGRWTLENNKSINGVWLRIEQISFKGICRFMLGEQKFTMQLPP